MGLRIGLPISRLEGISCSILFATAIFVADLKGDPRKEAFLEPLPSGDPNNEFLLVEEGEPRMEVRLSEEVMRRKKLAFRQSSSTLGVKSKRSKRVRKG